MAKKKTHKKFEEQLEKINKNITILTNYDGTHSYIGCQCLIDGHIWKTTPANLLQKHGCPKCSARKLSEEKIKPHEQFVKEIEIISPQIEVIGKYKGAKENVECRCKICNYSWFANPSNLLEGKGCFQCAIDYRAGLCRKSNEEFLERLYKIHNNNIIPLEEYYKMDSYIKCECNICHKTWNVKPDNLLQGKGCPYCKTSKGEKVIMDFLERNNIKYIYDTEYFIDLINENILRPDFIIEDKKIWIEYDGIQHFEPIDFAGKGEEWALEQFEKTKEKDRLKDEYAKENKWKLIRIPYWKFNDIENILKNSLLLEE